MDVHTPVTLGVAGSVQNLVHRHALRLAGGLLLDVSRRFLSLSPNQQCLPNAEDDKTILPFRLGSVYLIFTRLPPYTQV